jgi:hypothetical protein
MRVVAASARAPSQNLKRGTDMGTTFVATATAETFVDFGHVDEVVYEGGPFVIEKPSLFFDGAVWLGSDADFITDSIFFDQMLHIIVGEGQYDFIVPDNTVVDYSHSNAAVQINMNTVTSVGHGGFAEGDVLVQIFEVIGSGFNDVIRGSDIIPDSLPFVINGVNSPFENSFFINNPGDTRAASWVPLRRKLDRGRGLPVGIV